MSVAEIKQKLGEILDTLPERKLEVILDFASYLSERKGIGRRFFKDADDFNSLSGVGWFWK